jgi:hypothetical protein
MEAHYYMAEPVMIGEIQANGQFAIVYMRLPVWSVGTAPARWSLRDGVYFRGDIIGPSVYMQTALWFAR